MDIIFQTKEARCSSSASSEVSVMRDKDTFVIRGFVIVPNPCYQLTFNYELRAGELIVELVAKRKSGMCIQCIAQIPFEMRIMSIIKEIKNIIILYQKTELIRYRL